MEKLEAISLVKKYGCDTVVAGVSIYVNTEE